MKTKRQIKTPYQRLAEQFDAFKVRVKHPRTIQMWLYPKDRLLEGWSMASMYDRTAAAAQLGYDVQIFADMILSESRVKSPSTTLPSKVPVFV